MFMHIFTSVLYKLIALTSFANGYIYFAAHLDDLENVAKKLAPDGHPVERSRAIVHEPKDELRVDYYEELDPIIKDYRHTAENPEGEAGKDGQGRKLLGGRDTDIDALAKKIKERVLKELAEEFIRLKKQRKKKRNGKQRMEMSALKHRNVMVERELEMAPAMTPKTSVSQRERHVRPIEYEEELIMPTTRRLIIRQSVYTKPKVKIEVTTQRMPVAEKSEEIEIEKVDLGKGSNDSYEYYVVPPKDEIVFEAVDDEPVTPTTDTIRYKIEADADAEMIGVGTTKLPSREIDAMHRPIQQEPVYAAENVKKQEDPNTKAKGNDETYVMYEMGEASEEEPYLTQRTIRTAKTTQRITQRTTQRSTQRPTQRSTHGRTRKLIRLTRQRYSMTSPNYYASLPTIAERYDFNEPIPTKDRVRSI